MSTLCMQVAVVFVGLDQTSAAENFDRGELRLPGCNGSPPGIYPGLSKTTQISFSIYLSQNSSFQRHRNSGLSMFVLHFLRAYLLDGLIYKSINDTPK